MESTFISHFLPLGLLEHFAVKAVNELCFIKSKSVYIEIVLEENNIIIGDVDSSQYESKGFTEVTLQDFPIRGKAVYLVLRRRRWRHKQTASITHRNDFSYVAEGSGFTKELSDFLKATGKYKG